MKAVKRYHAKKSKMDTTGKFTNKNCGLLSNFCLLKRAFHLLNQTFKVTPALFPTVLRQIFFVRVKVSVNDSLLMNYIYGCLNNYIS